MMAEIKMPATSEMTIAAVTILGSDIFATLSRA